MQSDLATVAHPKSIVLGNPAARQEDFGLPHVPENIGIWAKFQKEFVQRQISGQTSVLGSERQVTGKNTQGTMNHYPRFKRITGRLV